MTRLTNEHGHPLLMIALIERLDQPKCQAILALDGQTLYTIEQRNPFLASKGTSTPIHVAPGGGSKSYPVRRSDFD